MVLNGGKCPTHDADLSKRNRAVRAAFAANDPARYQAIQQRWKGKRGADHPNWKGDQVKPHSARERARRRYPAKACQKVLGDGRQCGATKASSGKPLHRHHKDGNVRNNEPDNVEILCEDHHAAEHKGKYAWFAQAEAEAPARPITAGELELV